MQVIDGSFYSRVLLIGAGFSQNWGGLLATEVSGRIMAHQAVQARPRLRELLLHEASFEDALEKVRTGLYEEADAVAMETAIKAAFDSMDEGYKNPAPPVLSATINDFIAHFCPGPVGIGTGYVFSLNQDLLLERIYGTIVNRNWRFPGSRGARQRTLFRLARRVSRSPLQSIPRRMSLTFFVISITLNCTARSTGELATGRPQL